MLIDVGRLFLELLGAHMLHLQVSADDFVPGETLHGELLQERIGIKLLRVKHAAFTPAAVRHQHRADHCRHAGCVRYRLRADFFIAGFMIAHIVKVIGFVLAVFFAVKFCIKRTSAFFEFCVNRPIFFGVKCSYLLFSVYNQQKINKREAAARAAAKAAEEK